MAVQNAIYLPSATDLAAGATYDVGVAPAAPWDAGSNVTFAAGGPVVTSNNSAWAGINMAFVKVYPNCSMPMGADGAPLALYLNSGVGTLDYNGAAPRNYFKGGTTKTVKTVIYRPVVQSVGVFADMDVSTGFIVGSGGSVRIMTDVTLAGTLYVYGSGQCVLLMHSSDTAEDIWLSGRASLLIQRAMSSSSKMLFVPVGCTVTIDVTQTSGSTVSAADFVGVVVLCGGTVNLINGNLAGVKGISGTLDYSRLQRPCTITITETPDVKRIEGPVTATVTATSIGPGAQVVRAS